MKKNQNSIELAKSQKETLVALDLGSNSFHLIIAKKEGNTFKIIDKYKETIELAAGLNKQNELSAEAQQKAFSCASKIAGIINASNPDLIKIVGTSTFRLTRKSCDLLENLQSILNHKVNVISGSEEARLIFLGVTTALKDCKKRRLVIDIGGGSTEIIVGDATNPIQLDSLHLGCINQSKLFFPNGETNANDFNKAFLKAEQEIRPITHNFKRLGWDEAIGCSGTILAIERIVTANGWGKQYITKGSLEKLIHLLIKARHCNNLNLKIISDKRKKILAGGLTILYTLFNELKIEKMKINRNALREGLLYELASQDNKIDKLNI